MLIRKVSDNVIIIKPDVDLIDPVRSDFLTFLKKLSLDIDAIRDWELVFTEVVANAITHGSRLKSKDDVFIEWSSSKNSISLSVKDNGFGPESYLIENPRLPNDLMAMSGRGLFIIDSFADVIEHSKTRKGYTQTIKKIYSSELVLNPFDVI